MIIEPTQQTPGSNDMSNGVSSDAADVLYPNDATSAETEKRSAISSDPAEALYPDDVADSDDVAEDAEPTEHNAGEYRLVMPDGVSLDRELASQAAPVLRDIGLTNEQANKLVPLVSRVQERVVQSFNDDFRALRSRWAKQTQADPQIGGGKFARTKQFCGIALEAGGAPKGSEFRQLLDESGLGDHPAFVRVFRTLGQKLAASSGKAGGKRSTLEELYPDD